ncbi:MAG: aldehyde dehydrogenase family protein [Planctomycetota bacterium]|nr:MAG: aldehyde dehydrogenase family protein [Planctomycetota bacterium]
MVARAKAACESLVDYDQARTDQLCEAMVRASVDAAHELGRLAVEETGIGRVHYKILKNLFGAEGTWNSIKAEKTVGIIARDEAAGVIEVATPVGVVAGIIPTTNPTSTAIFKALIAVKGRNAIVISPHPRARRCIGATVEVLRRAIERAGGPPDLVQSLSNPTLESTGALMKHRDVSIILATGGTGLVKAAYSSGKPAYGVGPGNVPAYVDRSADVERAARDIVTSQSFDNATLCCSEQALILDRPIEDRMLAAMRSRGAHLCSEEETLKLGRVCNRSGGMNPDVVGKDPWRIAEMAGFAVPPHTTVLLARQGGVGPDWPLSIEILCPVLSVHVVDGWEEGCRTCLEVLHYEGLGHTLGIHCRDERVLDAFYLEKPANRILVNGPCSEGAVGYSTGLVPSMSLGCGPQAGNISSDNISARHLINVKRVAHVRRDFDEIARRMHERVAKLTGDSAPRGSGLPGDPAMAASPGPARGPSGVDAGADREGVSNWRGNPTFVPRTAPGGSQRPAQARTGAGMRPKVQPAPKAFPPTFTRPAAEAAPAATAVLAPPSAPAKTATTVGGALSASDVRSIMEHAGGGCPLGPCKGCPHNDVRTGACMA